jgi:hypothetical protein
MLSQTDIVGLDNAIKINNYGHGATFSASVLRTLKLDKLVDPNVSRLFIKRGDGLPKLSFLKDHVNVIDIVGISFHRASAKWVAKVHALGIRVSGRDMASLADYKLVQDKLHFDQVVANDVSKARHVRWLWRSAHNSN